MGLSRGQGCIENDVEVSNEAVTRGRSVDGGAHEILRVSLQVTPSDLQFGSWVY